MDIISCIFHDGKRQMNLPDNNTLKILEERKNYLITKKDANVKSYIPAEIGALDRAMNLIKLVHEKIPDEILKKIITESEPVTKTNGEEHDDNAKYDVLYSYEKEIAKDLKLDISFIKYKDDKHVILALKKYKRNLLKWAYQGKVRTTLEILEEILEKSKEI
ncbi:MAG: hypothetical protein LBB61_01815 [Treponema sp.]|nr:hypothetical protein [Treponema sp.]